MSKLELNKQELRERYTLIREKITDKEKKSSVIFNKVIKNKAFIEAKTVALYKSLKSEVNTDELIKYSLNIGKIVVLPRVEDNELKFYKLSSFNDTFVKSSFGVEEPIKNTSNLIHKETIDLVIVPGLCFDSKNNRLGYGKGYYDRFIKDSNLKTLAICFEEQILYDSIIPTTENDVKMQQIITEKGVKEVK